MAKLSPAPCDRCGYNGPGYYQPETHPCAVADERDVTACTECSSYSEGFCPKHRPQERRRSWSEIKRLVGPERDVATAVERLTNPNMWPSPIPGWAQKYILALCDALAQAQDAITRAIDRMAPDAPNHDPHMLCAAVTLMEAKLAQAQQDRDHEQHEKETVAESGQAMVKHLRGKLAQAQQKVREALDDPTAELSDGIDRLVLDLNTEHEQVAQAQQENVGLDRGLTALGRTVSELEDARDENAKLCEEAQQEIERLLERIDRVRDYITTAMRPGSVQAACCETAYDRAHRAGLKHALNALDAEEFQQPARVVKAGALARELARAQDKAIDQMVKGDILAARDVLDEARANPAVQALLRD